MKYPSEGCALVLIYEDGRRTSVLSHEHDGGEAYMGPLLRKAVQYAKVQYGSGDISQILLAEADMALICGVRLTDHCRKLNVRHIYYVTVRWDAEETKKTYHIYGQHLAPGEVLTGKDIPEFESAFSRKNVTFRELV